MSSAVGDAKHGMPACAAGLAHQLGGGRRAALVVAAAVVVLWRLSGRRRRDAVPLMRRISHRPAVPSAVGSHDICVEACIACAERQPCLFLADESFTILILDCSDASDGISSGRLLLL